MRLKTPKGVIVSEAWKKNISILIRVEPGFGELKSVKVS